MDKLFRPMLAVDFDEKRLRFPYYASPKLDGIRCVVLNGEARTRSLKLFPNTYVDTWFRERGSLLDGLDGEIVVGDPTAADAFQQTTSGLMSVTGRPSFVFYVFDLIDAQRKFTDRATEANARLVAARKQGILPNTVDWLTNKLVHNAHDLGTFEHVVLNHGYEGVMLRHPEGRYKRGRATLNEGTLLKVKRFRDAEAIVVGVEEQMHNGNVAFKSELGRTKRSTARAGLVGKETAGALIVKGAPGQPFADIQFGIGTGMDDKLRSAIWENREQMPGLRLRYKYLEIGVKDAPRHPVFGAFVVPPPRPI